ncbi:GNAT family N-acetyltransferase [Spirosoma foliorum]|uniref:GNAT family N-acetyltransferase n=1 Tax=Spirosoma foliorum TaxID=2710596 RepID=A0A7G5H1A9_9BACT|nr:GNAT family N-acetyltransferase [Spirosoma foliorum]QMW04901.1 GNAT family N-acetyltransferase [Spirosoma foliorum]
MIKAPTYKNCSANEISRILEIYRQSYLEHYTYLWSDESKNYIKTSFTEGKLLAEMNVHKSAFYLISYNNFPVGVLKINTNKSIDGSKDVDYLEIERIYFLRAATGKGLGKSTLKMVKQLAIDGNKKIIWLKAMKGADAVKFYEKQGFMVTGETDLSYPFIIDEFKRMVVMQLYIR